ncbi:MAG: TetR/AcrR family transcriptional regulator [Bdellovibrionota bacterium]|nr:MAG: TetR/AcrR family transcriptional regulator [Pseudomonadota bacterium]
MPTDRIEGLTTARFASIISVALDEFASARYNDASFNRIIKNCQMAKGTMYYYFKSKEDLFLTIHKATLRDFKNLAVLAATEARDSDGYWRLCEDLLLEFYRTLYRRPSASQFVTNFLTHESRREGHPAIATVNAIDEWLKDFLYAGQTLGAVRADLDLSQIATLAWGIWESCRSWFPSEANRMQAPVHPDIILDLYRRALTPIGEAIAFESDDSFAGVDQTDDSPFQGALPDDLDLTPDERDAEELKAREAKAQSLLRSFKGPL